MDDPEQIQAQIDKLAAQKPFAELRAASAELSAFAKMLDNITTEVVKQHSYVRHELRDGSIRQLRDAVLNDQGKSQMRFNAALDAIMRHPLMVDVPAAPEEAPPQGIPMAVATGDTEAFGGSDYPYECDYCMSPNHATSACPARQGFP